MGYMCALSISSAMASESLAIVGVRFVRRGDGVGSASCAIDETTTGLHLRASRRWRKGGRDFADCVDAWEAWKASDMADVDVGSGG